MKSSFVPAEIVTSRMTLVFASCTSSRCNMIFTRSLEPHDCHLCKKMAYRRWKQDVRTSLHRSKRAHQQEEFFFNTKNLPRLGSVQNLPWRLRRRLSSPSNGPPAAEHNTPDLSSFIDKSKWKCSECYAHCGADVVACLCCGTPRPPGASTSAGAPAPAAGSVTAVAAVAQAAFNAEVIP